MAPTVEQRTRVLAPAGERVWVHEQDIEHGAVPWRRPSRHRRGALPLQQRLRSA